MTQLQYERGDGSQQHCQHNDLHRRTYGNDLFSHDAFPFPPRLRLPLLTSPSSASNLPVVPSMSLTSRLYPQIPPLRPSSLPLAQLLQDQVHHIQMEILLAATAMAANSEAIATTDDIFREIELWDSSHPLDHSFLFPGDCDRHPRAIAIQEKPQWPHCVDGLSETPNENKDEADKDL